MKRQSSLHKSIATSTLMLCWLATITPVTAYTITDTKMSDKDLSSRLCSEDKLFHTLVNLDTQPRLTASESGTMHLFTNNSSKMLIGNEQKFPLVSLTERDWSNESSLEYLLEQCTVQFMSEHPQKSDVDNDTNKILGRGNDQNVNNLDDFIYISFILLLISRAYGVKN